MESVSTEPGRQVHHAVSETRRAGDRAEASVGSARCVITGTGFAGEKRQQLKALVQALGAEYSGALGCGRSTQLVFCQPEGLTETEKYRKAKQWMIPVVALSWLQDSVRAGAVQPMQPYIFDPDRPLSPAAPPNVPSSVSQRPRPAAALRAPSRETTPDAAGRRTAAAGALASVPALASITPGQQRRADARAAAGNAEAALLHASAEAETGHRTSSHPPEHTEGRPRVPPAAPVAEPERRRAARQQPASFCLDILQGCQSPGEGIEKPAEQHANEERPRGAHRADRVGAQVHWAPSAAGTPSSEAPPVSHAAVRNHPFSDARSDTQTPHAAVRSPGQASASRGRSVPNSGRSDAALALALPASPAGKRTHPGPRSGPTSTQGTPVRCTPSQPCKAPRFSTAKQFHGLQSSAGITYFSRLQVTLDNAPGSESLHFKVHDRTHGPLLYTADGPQGEHVLSFAEILAVYELRGEIWIEHRYYYDEEDIRIDSRGQGASFLRQHRMHAAELIACAVVYHSRAAAIEGHFRLFETKDAATAAAASAGAEEPAMFSVRSWDPATGLLVPGRAKRTRRPTQESGRSSATCPPAQSTRKRIKATAA